MYIQPNSDIRILRGVPLDPDYVNTLSFRDPIYQYGYFNQKVVHTLSGQYFRRIQDNVARVEVPIGEMYSCNYMMFRNTSFSNKWFYAFITNVEYVNNETTEITFKLDVMQTWFFNYEMEECYIEREHSATDEIGDNIQPEPFNITDFVYQSFSKLYQGLENFCVVVALARTISNPFIPSAQLNIYDNVIQGCDLYAFEVNSGGVQALTRLINDYKAQPENIIDMYAVPTFALPSGTQFVSGDVPISSATPIPSQYTGRSDIADVIKPTVGLPFIDGVKAGNDALYIPKNNKMYTYPYYYFEISNTMGQTVNYAFEDFSGDTASFAILSTMTNPVQLSVYPRYYKRTGESDTLPPNGETCITIANYPRCMFSEDTYMAWMAQNSVPMLLSALASPLNGIIHGMSGGGEGAFIGAGLSFANEGINQASQAYTKLNSSDHHYGAVMNGGVLHAQKMFTFNVGVKHIPNQMARVVDNFFTMYGYACNHVATPQKGCYTRPLWYYVKTRGCQIRANFPEEYVREITAIFDRGVRFWNSDHSDSVGNYSGNNTPTGVI